MLQKLFVSYQLRADPLRKEWLLAAPALQRPAIAGLSRCAKDQMTAADTHPARRPCWAWLSLGEGHGPRGTPGAARLQTRCCVAGEGRGCPRTPRTTLPRACCRVWCLCMPGKGHEGSKKPHSSQERHPQCAPPGKGLSGCTTFWAAGRVAQEGSWAALLQAQPRDAPRATSPLVPSFPRGTVSLKIYDGPPSVGIVERLIENTVKATRSHRRLVVPGAQEPGGGMELGVHSPVPVPVPLRQNSC